MNMAQVVIALFCCALLGGVLYLVAVTINMDLAARQREKGGKKK